KFNLIPTQQQNKFVSKGGKPADLAEQLASDIVKPVARQKTFTSQQVREGGPEFGAFFFGKTRPGFTPSTAPLSDLLLFETRYSRLAGTRVGTAP
ncbi:MAG: hypothetical protein LV468_03030, partial [Candidatus Nitrosotenuis sp.]|nr:hypothetical protein [Candidatus Nitrosotenuis sp.]